MKKLVSIVMAIALGVSLAGCGGRASAESVVEDAIQAFQNADAEAIEQYWGDTDFSSSNGTAEEDAYTRSSGRVDGRNFLSGTRLCFPTG